MYERAVTTIGIIAYVYSNDRVYWTCPQSIVLSQECFANEALDSNLHSTICIWFVLQNVSMDVQLDPNQKQFEIFNLYEKYYLDNE